MKTLTKLAGAALAVGALFATAPVSAKEVVLRAVSSFQQGSLIERPFARFGEKVNAEGKGLVQINYMGGPSAMPPFEVGNSVASGVIDIALVTAAFYTNLLPAGDVLRLTESSIQDLRKNGGWEYSTELHNKKMISWYLARTGDNVPFPLYVNKPVEKADLSGLTLRVPPVYRAFFEALNASSIQTPPSEVYTALERGVVDGYGWPIQGVLDLGWQIG